MKHVIKSLTLVAMLAAVCSGCKRETMGFMPGEGEGDSDNRTGYITFVSGGITVEWNGENVNTPTDGSDQIPEFESALTRAAVNTDNFMVKVVRVYPDTEEQYSPVMAQGTFAELKARNVLELPFTRGGRQCRYQVLVNSGSTMADTAWDDTPNQPTYSGKSEEFTLNSSNSTPETAKRIGDINCSLESIKVSVSLEKHMAEMSSNITLTAYVHGRSQENRNDSSPSLVFGDSATGAQHHFGVVWLDEATHEIDKTQGTDGFEIEPSCGYFKPLESKNHITLHIEMDYEDEFKGNKPHISQDIKICTGSNLASANEYRRILLYITHGDEEDLGQIIVNAVVETWTYGKEVDIDIVSGMLASDAGEDAIPDIDSPDAPRITSPDLTFDDLNTFDASSFNTSGAYVPSAVVNIATKNAVEQLELTLSTGNPNLAGIYSSFGAMNTPIDLMSSETTSAHTYLQTLGFPSKTDIGTKTDIRIDLRTWLGRLYMYGGSHSLTIAVSDTEGNTSRRQLNFRYDSENGEAGDVTAPSIVWPDHDFSTRYTIYDGMKVDINISAPAGIKSLMVHMEGSIANALGSLMPADFDLVEPDKYQDDLSTALKELKFPVGDEVKDRTSLLFDISDFMPMLQGTTENESDFQLTVTDNNNNQTSATIRLNVVK